MWVVVQTTEDDVELVGLYEFRALEHAEMWIEENKDNYPESTFSIEWSG